tara:strand:- start:564 stop:812 length:249 start_codon:yes stop_codon:yes gene_type:complete
MEFVVVSTPSFDSLDPNAPTLEVDGLPHPKLLVLEVDGLKTKLEDSPKDNCGAFALEEGRVDIFIPVNNPAVLEDELEVKEL